MIISYLRTISLMKYQLFLWNNFLPRSQTPRSLRLRLSHLVGSAHFITSPQRQFRHFFEGAVLTRLHQLVRTQSFLWVGRDWCSENRFLGLPEPFPSSVGQIRGTSVTGHHRAHGAGAIILSIKKVTMLAMKRC